MSYYAGGHPADAIPLLEKVQGWISRANVDGYYILGTCYIQTSNYDRGTQLPSAKMFDVPADSAAAYLFTARMLLRQEYDPIAEEYAQKADIARSEASVGALSCSANFTCTNRACPEAIAEFQKELAINPAHAATYYKLADAYSRVQKYDDAQRLLQRSIRLDATSSVPFILMGKVLEKKGDYDLAVLSLKHAVTMEPNNPTTHHLLGQAYRDMGNKEAADAESEALRKCMARKIAGSHKDRCFEVSRNLTPVHCRCAVIVSKAVACSRRRLDFDIHIHQRNGSRRHAWNA